MTPDHYAALGLSPTSEDVVIRAAYLALMRRYHPDTNPSAAAAARTRAINAAYAVLGDPERRADYDELRGEQAAGYALAERRRAPPTGLFAAAAILLLLVLLPLAIWLPKPMPVPLRQPPDPQPTLVQAPAPAPTPAAQHSEPTPPPDDPPPAPSPPAPRLAATLPPPVLKTRAPVHSPPAEASTARNLANLDRQQALLFGQSWGRANEAKRAQLLSTRDRFLARRDACRSHACTSGAYLARMREVSEIMTGQSLLPQRPLSPQKTPQPAQ